jgi:hypothetical protein
MESMSSEKDNHVDDDLISPIETNILRSAIEKLNFVSKNGSGTSLSEDEMRVFRYWLGRRRVRAVENARFGEIYEIMEV